MEERIVRDVECETGLNLILENCDAIAVGWDSVNQLSIDHTYQDAFMADGEFMIMNCCEGAFIELNRNGNREYLEFNMFPTGKSLYDHMINGQAVVGIIAVTEDGESYEYTVKHDADQSIYRDGENLIIKIG